jgi:hypothetical protein
MEAELKHFQPAVLGMVGVALADLVVVAEPCRWLAREAASR